MGLPWFQRCPDFISEPGVERLQVERRYGLVEATALNSFESMDQARPGVPVPPFPKGDPEFRAHAEMHSCGIRRSPLAFDLRDDAEKILSMGRAIIAVTASVGSGDDKGADLIFPLADRPMPKELSVLSNYGDIVNLDLFDGARLDMQHVSGPNAGEHARPPGAKFRPAMIRKGPPDFQGFYDQAVRGSPAARRLFPHVNGGGQQPSSDA